MKRISAIEVVWLSVMVTSLFVGLHDTSLRGLTYSYPFFIMAVTAFLLYRMRRTMRQKRERENF